MHSRSSSEWERRDVSPQAIRRDLSPKAIRQNERYWKSPQCQTLRAEISRVRDLRTAA
jgi:hypothetical protein